MVRLTRQELKSIDDIVKRVLREPPILEAFGIRQVANGKREHMFLSASDMPTSNIGADFSYDARNYPMRIPTGTKLTFITFPVQIKRTDIDASESAGIESLAVTAEIEANAAIMKDVEDVVLHGNNARGSKGMCNYDGLNHYGADASKALTTHGSFFTQLEGAISQVRENHIKPGSEGYDLIISPGIFPELRNNWVTGIYNEYKQFKETYTEGPAPVIGNIIETDEICTDSNGNATGCFTDTQGFIVGKLGQPNNYIAESYELHRDLIPGEFESDVNYALRWAGGFIPKEPKALCLVTGLTTTTAY